jgi:methylated-DNA-[protein]-cysteine S-methyltransferase
MSFNLSRIASPLGTLCLVTDDLGQLWALDFADHQARLMKYLRERHGNKTLQNDTCAAPGARAASTALLDYFGGHLAVLEDIDIASAGSALEHRVWNAIRRLPAGKVVGFRELAVSLGLEDDQSMIRVGAAIAANPLRVVVPCHRVVASDGYVEHTPGYAYRVRWLLEHEHALPKTIEPRRTPGFPGMP